MPVAPTEELLREARKSLPELPMQRAERYEQEVGLTRAPAVSCRASGARLLLRGVELAGEEADPVAVRQLGHRRLGELPQAGGRDAGHLTPDSVAGLVDLVAQKKISHGAGKPVLEKLAAEGGDPAEIVEREGLAQISDAAELEGIVDPAIEAEPEAAEEVRQGTRRRSAGSSAP